MIKKKTLNSIFNIFTYLPLAFLVKGDLRWILVCFQCICFGWSLGVKLND